MIAPARSVPARFLLLFAALYALQGVVVAYLFNFNKAYMQASGLGPSVIGGVQSLALTPMILKFLIGPVSDRINLGGWGHRLPWIVVGLVLQAAGLVGLAVVDPGRHLGAFAGLAVLTVIGLSAYDTCGDGLAVDLTPSADRARVQGLLWTSRFVAATLGTLGFGFTLQWLGGPARADRLLWASAAVTLAPLALALSLVEPPRVDSAERFTWSALGVMVRPWSLALLAFGSLYGLAGMAVETNLSPFYQTLGFDPGGDVGVLGSTRNLGRIGGAVLLPIVLARWSRRGVLVVGVLGMALAALVQIGVRDRGTAALAGLGFGLAMGWDDTLFAALAMDAADPRLAASTFALFMAVTNVSVLGDALFSRGVETSGGYREPFLGTALVALLCLPLVPGLARPGPNSVEPAPDGNVDADAA